MRLHIHTVFRLRENLLFLEEWLDYHLQLGFDRIYLFDNSTSIGYDGSNEQVNKYGINFTRFTENYSDEDVSIKFKRIVSQFGHRVCKIDWAPVDQHGNVIYGQKESIVNYINTYSAHPNTWTAFIDIDEFVYCDYLDGRIDTVIRYMIEKYKTEGIVLSQKKFQDRFDNIEIPVTQITKCVENIDTRQWGEKYIIKNSVFNFKGKYNWTIHTLPLSTEHVFIPDSSALRINHYNVNQRQLIWMKEFYNSKQDFCLDSHCFQLFDKLWDRHMDDSAS